MLWVALELYWTKCAVFVCAVAELATWFSCWREAERLPVGMGSILAPGHGCRRGSRHGWRVNRGTLRFLSGGTSSFLAHLLRFCLHRIRLCGVQSRVGKTSAQTLRRVFALIEMVLVEQRVELRVE